MAAAARAASVSARVWKALATVADPEIPVVSVVDLGIVRQVETDGDVVSVVITPTYSGCPATEAIERDIRRALAQAGFGAARVRTALAPAWTTDWISAEGRSKLARYGIAPPGARPAGAATVRLHRREPAEVPCPRCGSRDTERVAEFGSTACKALMRCRACLEPFDYFKPL